MAGQSFATNLLKSDLQKACQKRTPPKGGAESPKEKDTAMLKLAAEEGEEDLRPLVGNAQRLGGQLLADLQRL